MQGLNKLDKRKSSEGLWVFMEREKKDILSNEMDASEWVIKFVAGSYNGNDRYLEIFNS